MIKYVGADVHGQTTCFCVLDSSGQKIMETTVATTSAALESFVRALSGEVHVAFEEGTQAQWLYYLLSRQVKRVVVCDPKKLSRRRSGISKTAGGYCRWFLALDRFAPQCLLLKLERHIGSPTSGRSGRIAG